MTVTLIGNEISCQHPDDIKIFRKAGEAFAKANFSQKLFVNADSGHSIKVTSSGIGHSINGAMHDRVKALAGLDALLIHGVLTATEPDKKLRPNIKAIHKYSCALQISGKQLELVLTVRELSTGEFHFYDLGIIKQ